MNVVHVPFGYFPDAVGGTEVYVAELARGLTAHGVSSVIAAPAVGDAGRYEHDGIPVHRFAVAPARDVAELYGDGDDASARAIATIVDEAHADVLHLHAFTRAASVRAARLARARGAAVVFTYHTPTASCVRGTLLRDGEVPCDGALIADRCAACLLQSRGVPLAARRALAQAPAALGHAIGRLTGGSIGTALRVRELTALRHRAFEQLLDECDAVVAVCDWVRALLIRAGASPDRLVLSRQGTPAALQAAPHRQASDTTRLAFVGRLHPTKGVHVAIRAIVQEPELPVSFDVYGVIQDAEGDRYLDELLALGDRDPRIRFAPPVPASRVVETLGRYDATVVPSQWLETGPLTILESFAAGVPVIGSNLGGIAELVSHDRDGWLVPYGDLSAWRSALRRIATDRALAERLADGVRPPRTTADVARDMADLYRSIVPGTDAIGLGDQLLRTRVVPKHPAGRAAPLGVA